MRALLRGFALLLVACAALVAHAGPLDADFARLENALRLKPAQKEQFDLAAAASRRMLLGTAMSALQAKNQLAEELARDAPDFARIYRISVDIVEQNRPLVREAGSEWSKLYALLDADQLVIARRFVEQKLELLR